MNAIYVAITDSEWFDNLKNQKNNIGKHINFWTPGDKEFKALNPNDLFVFKRHDRKSKGEHGEIIGFANFSSFEKNSLQSAWQKYGLGNGVLTLHDMETKINKYRKKNSINPFNTNIGCIILSNPIFFDQSEWISSPKDWSKSIVRGKKYTMDSVEAKILLSEISKRIEHNEIENVYEISDKANDFEDETLNKSISYTRIVPDKQFIYNAIPEKKTSPHCTKKGVFYYKRNRERAINALNHAQFKCEINFQHPTFIRKIDNIPYTEAHHLIPMAFQDDFDYSIDIEENIVSLCSNCHNEIHYGINSKVLITQLYKQRKNLLKSKGINITLEKLLSYYNL